ncbi:hypothetical protein [Acidipropionibacterium timonense]|uniref:hypothetical protein n=1 Tax=Acidipropionibacterium timonense TaxID=2161818 RepID=UPI00103182D6|nr:hypothetical protein [Acidipropionibacterium timonense]
MDEDQAPLQFVETENGYLVVGSAPDLARLDEVDGLETSPVDLPGVHPRALGEVATAVSTTSGIAAVVESYGDVRWLKLTEESSEFLRHHGISSVTSGVVRGRDLAAGSGTQIAKHLTFESVTLANPMALAQLSNLALQMSIRQSFDRMEDYLQDIDAKVDWLIQDRKDEEVARARGIRDSIDEAAELWRSTGRVDDTTWSKVSGNSRELRTLQHHALAALQSAAHRIEATTHKSLARRALAVKAERDNIAECLRSLADSMRSQDQMRILELAHLEHSTPAELTAHQQGLMANRRTQFREITSHVAQTRRDLLGFSSMRDIDRVSHPRSAATIIEAVKAVHAEFSAFATSTGIDLGDVAALDDKTWARAMKDLANGAIDTVTSTASGGARTVSSALGAVQHRGARTSHAVAGHARGALDRIRHRDDTPELAAEDPGDAPHD